MTRYRPEIPGKFGGYIFFHIPRTGGNSIVQMLSTTHLGRGDSQLIGAHTPARDVYRHFEVRKNLRAFNLALKFSVVRNPFDWLVSLYEYHRQRHGSGIHDLVAPMSFSEFLRYYTEKHMKIKRQYGTNAASTFTKFLSDADGNLLTDRILRFEHYDRDVIALLTEFGYQQTSTRHVNAIRRKPYAGYYRVGDRAVVERVFAEDLERFGYRF